MERRAIEALRNGVPNEDAVRVLGCDQPEVEARFTAQLAAMDGALERDEQVPGLLIAGGFGTGKSHVLEYLAHLASAENFVTSRIVISKETPLYDPAKVFRAAVETAQVPGRTGMAIHEIALALRQDTSAYADLYKWANHPDSVIAPIFPATLLLHERLNNDPELSEEVRNFWAGDALPVRRVRDGLRQLGELATFSIRTVKARELAEQRFSFAARLIRGAGYRGWVLLIDELELVGRYSLLQRGRSYAELAHWMGAIEDLQHPGITAVAAVTDDFDLAVLQEKGDRDYVGPKLRSRASDDFMTLAARAETGMRLLAREAVTLNPPTAEALRETHERLREIHARAYSWSPSEIESSDISMRRAMRSHVRRLINEWDLQRLYPGVGVNIEEQELRSNYTEDTTLESPEEPELSEGDGSADSVS
jgi:hypothetical protein